MTHSFTQKFERIVFCDFDGTISSTETFIEMFIEFAPDVFTEVATPMMNKEISIRDGVKIIVESIPSSKYSDILKFTKARKVRPGFEEFLDFLNSKGVPFVVISGGLQGMVKTKIGKYENKIHAMYAADVSTDEEYLKVISDYEGGTELVAKADIIKQYEFEECISIGDGFTDITMAKVSDLVFARDSLATTLDEMNLSYMKWNDFNDIRQHLEKRWR